MTDPYLITSQCAKRLLKEYERHPKLILAVDYDSTVFPYGHPDDTHEHVLSLVKEAQRRGFYIVLFTASAPERFPAMRAFMAAQGITVDSINENPIPLPFGHHGKIYYNLLLDDRAGLGQACETLEYLFTLIDDLA